MTATTTKAVLYDKNIKPPALCSWTTALLCTANVERSPEDPQPHSSGFYGFQVLNLEGTVTFGLAGTSLGVTNLSCVLPTWCFWQAQPSTGLTSCFHAKKKKKKALWEPSCALPKTVAFCTPTE